MGNNVGDIVGLMLGLIVGETVGDIVGETVGDIVGDSVHPEQVYYNTKRYEFRNKPNHYF